ncbi:hypothetical protein [Natronorubrum sp. DTA28]|uniref:hypothetical protein n=1 Tax=Natronorubrum sp. DTA28 TaxID=3447019 RepID=UPI003F8639BC
MTPLRNALRVTGSSDRLFATAIVVVLLETVVRFALAVTVSPVAGVLWPPVVAVVGLASVGPTVRDRLVDGSDGTTTSDGTVGGRLPSLVVVALGGHALAVAGGVALFLLVDTPVRYGLYWLGRGDLLSPLVIQLSPFVGVTVGTLLAWIVPAIAVVRVVDGATGVEALREALVEAVTQPRAVGGLVVVQLVLAVVFEVAVGLASWASVGFDSGPQHGFIDHLFVPLAVVVGGTVPTFSIALGGLVWVLGGTIWFALVFVLTVDRFSRPRGPSPERKSQETTVSVTRLAILVLLLTALVATAGAVRMGEVRPMDTSPDPLPDDPDELYATAFENTDRSSHEYRYYIDDDQSGEPDEHVLTVRIDREDRQHVAVSELARVYRSTATIEMEGTSGYPHAENREYKTGEPAAAITNWTIREERDDEIVLELTDPDDVFYALTGNELSDRFDDPKVVESRGSVTVDADRKTISSGEFRLNVTDGAPDSEQRYDTHVAFEYDVDIDVERPAELGEPSVSERLWKLFAY